MTRPHTSSFLDLAPGDPEASGRWDADMFGGQVLGRGGQLRRWIEGSVRPAPPG